MLKKLFAFLICIILVFVNIPFVFAEEPVVSISFANSEAAVGDVVDFTVAVDKSVKSFTAYVYTNGYVNVYSSINYDMDLNEYVISFDPSKGDFTAQFYATIKGEGIVYLTNIVCVTDSGTYELGTEMTSISITPRYTPIYTKDDLNNIRNNLSGDYKLMNDIVFDESDFEEGGKFYNDGYGWSPIGLLTTEAFSGTFFGNGHTISGLKINNAKYYYNGLFGVSSGKITDLRIKDADINAVKGINTGVSVNSEEAQQIDNTARAGIDYNDKDTWTKPDNVTAEEFFNKFDRTGDSDAVVGIICGLNKGTIDKCYAEGTVAGNKYVGGIAAVNNKIIKNCGVNVNVASADIAGGIAGGTTSSSKIYDCVTEGVIEAAAKGGIVGAAAGQIMRAYSIISADTVAGGNAELTEVYVTKEKDAYKLTFSSGDWNYEKKIPYPTALADLIPEPEAAFGDVNNDRTCDTLDLAVLKLYLAGAVDSSYPDLVRPDVNGDGIEDTTDLAVLKLYLAGASV